MRPTTKASVCLFIVFLITIFKGTDSCSQSENIRPVEDVFKVMGIVKQSVENPLWPGFNVSEIPVMVFDSINTWLFFSNIQPDGFTGVKDHKEIFMFTGQYPLVRGNSIIRVGDKWIAASVFSTYSRRTGDRYSAKDLAGIIIHEQFHIFQRNIHPQWRQNDGLLLLYPTETKEALFLRRIEKEAFKRAVISDKPGEIAGWVKEALSYREQRLNMINSLFSRYEMELQRTEGLSDYIEKIARGLDPLNASDITNGIASAGVRDLGYVEGRWIAMILDRLSPDWKSVLEANDTLYLEDILKKVTSVMPGNAISFNSGEIDKIRAEADDDFFKWKEMKKQEIEEFNDMPGFRIRINASSKPLSIRIFEPLEIEILDDGSVYHRLIFSAGNDAGTLRVMNQPCITRFDDSLQIVELMLNGLEESPEINENENRIQLKNNNISIDLKYTKISVDNSLYSVEL
jgi:hypothetical protein